MPVVTSNPRFTVTLYKMLHHQQGAAARYQAAQRTIDLTPYLGEDSSIRISKNLTRPDGAWEIVFGDQPDGTTGDTLYALIEPMDVVEIRGSRTPFNYAGDKLPLLMRGFVNKVRRPEAITERGPSRSVVVRGGDWGRLWLIHGVWMEVALSQELPLLTTFQLQDTLGIGAQVMDVGKFMQIMTTQVMNRKIQAMAAFASPQILPQFTCQSSVSQGIVVPQAVGLFPSGPFWNVVKNFADAPWNELWVDDSDEEGPVLVFRPAPFQDINGNWLGGATDPGTIDLDYGEVTAIEVGRSDDRVANFFWTPPGQSLLDTPNMVAAYDILAGSPFDFNHPNNEPALYGYRKMEWPTQLYPGSLAQYPIDQTPSEQQQSTVAIREWHIQRGQLLEQMNQDNALFEDGVIRARGREDFRPGQYLQFTRGSVVSRAYITEISHSIAPFSSWSTNLVVDRGNGFLVRNKMPGSPYWAEGRPPSYGPAISA